MSHFTTVKTLFSNSEVLIAALKEAFGWEAEYSPARLPLFGYLGDDRSLLEPGNPNYSLPCEIRINRSQVGHNANDLGFLLDPTTGHYQAIVSEFDSRHHFTELDLQTLTREYSRQSVLKVAKEKNWDVIEVKKGLETTLTLKPKKVKNVLLQR